MKLGKKISLNWKKYPVGFKLAKKIQFIKLDMYSKLENCKNIVLIDRGLGSFIYYVVVSFMAFSDHVRENEYFALTHPNTLIP